MKRILNIALVVAGIFASVIVAQPKTVPGVATREFHNEAIVYGLHVALPDDMKNFPTALVPLP